MADLSLDDFIARKKGPNLKEKQNARKQFQGKPYQLGRQAQNFKSGVSQKNRLGGIQRKGFFTAGRQKAKFGNMKGVSSQNKSSVTSAQFGQPGKGQIDARDMITIKNRIKIPDARAKIIMKRMNQGKLNAAQHFQGPGQQQTNPGPQGPGPFRPQQFNLQTGLPPHGPTGQQQPRPLFQQPRPLFQQQGPQINRLRMPGFNQPQRGRFNPQQAQPFGRQQEPQFTKQQPPLFGQQHPPFNQQRPHFIQEQGQLFGQVMPQFNQGQTSSFHQPTQFQDQNAALNQQPPQFNQQPPQFNQQPPQFSQEQGPFIQEQPTEFGPQDPLFSQQPLHFSQQSKVNQPQPQFIQQLQFNQLPQVNQAPPQNFIQEPAGLHQAPSNFHQRAPGVNNVQPGFNQHPPSQNQLGSSNVQSSSNFHQPPAGFGQSQPTFSQPNPLGPDGDDDDGDISFQSGNAVANGSTVVEDTGTSLKITRTIPEVTFDGENLTVTRRVPVTSQQPKAPVQSAYSSGLPRPEKFIASGPAVPTQKKKFKPTPIQAPSTSVSVGRTQPEPQPLMNKPMAPSPTTAHSFTHTTVQSAIAAPATVRPTSSQSFNARKTIMKNVNAPASAPVRRTLHAAPHQQSRLKPPPQASPAVSHHPAQPAVSFTNHSAQPSVSFQNHPTQPATRTFQLQTQNRQSALARLQIQNNPMSSSNVPIAQRLAPRPSAPPQPSPAQKSISVTRTTVKRPAPVSLSERFGLGGGGNPIPVITDHAPVKRRRPTEEFEKPEYQQDFEVKQFQAQTAQQEPGAIMLSPLQGFRIQVSNLHSGVTQDDIIELFGVLGPLKRANLLANGQAEVAFVHKEHASLALKTYHNRELDGQPMFVKLTTPLNAKVMQTPSGQDGLPSLPDALRTKKPPAPGSAPVEIPLIHKALFKTATETVPSKAVRFTVKL